ncbi:evolutionarily conserved C-terminal region 11 isoform X2 [Tasmannia lanceolata]
MEVRHKGLISNSLAKSALKDLASGIDGGPSDSTACISLSRDATNNVKGGGPNQELVAEKGIYHPPTSCYGYCYPGYDGTYPEWDDQGNFFARKGVEVPYSASGFRSTGPPKGYYPMGKVSSVSGQGYGGLHLQNGFSKFLPRGQNPVGSDRFKMRENFQKRDFNASELTRGPRADRVKGPLSSSAEKEQLIHTRRRDQYNREDFPTQYEQAMFFVIKSYSEDDVHKSIKYNVWASTPNGNKKLDAAFHDAETKSREKGTRCPIFLFFSVNGSGQFVGLAEMIGQVDFKKSMNFWQQDKWNGFFPVKWHIVKDASNNHFRHIILENNDKKAVTNSRDTQEIRLSKGTEMLNIFKSYTAKTSILDDFDFYEDREKSLHGRRSATHSLPNPEVNNNYHAPGQKEVGARKFEEASSGSYITFSDPKGSLITLTKNLSLNPQSP